MNEMWLLCFNVNQMWVLYFDENQLRLLYWMVSWKLAYFFTTNQIFFFQSYSALPAFTDSNEADVPSNAQYSIHSALFV